MIKKIKERLNNKGTDRPTTSVVGVAIYLANEGITQTEVNFILSNVTGSKYINLTRLVKFLDL